MDEATLSIILLSGVLITGIILGKSFKTVLFNVHKLISVGFIFYMGFVIFRFAQLKTFDTSIISIIIIGIISAAVLLATGAFMGMGKGNYGTMRILHIVFTVVLSVASGFLLYSVSG